MPSLGQVLGHWSFEPLPLLLAAAYLWAAARRRWPWRRSAAFLAGVAAIEVALGSGLAYYDDRLLSLHMVQHLMLVLVAAPLLVLGRPGELALRLLHGGARRRFARLMAVLAWPLVGWTAFAVVILGSHTPVLFQAAIRHPALHALEHTLYLGAAVLFWWPLLDSAHARLGMVGRLLYVILAMPVMSVVGVALSEARSVVYPVYLAPARELHVSALHDQARAGAIMWAIGAMLMAAAAIVVAWLALSAEEARARRREAYEDARLPT